MRKLDKERAEAIQQFEYIRQKRPDVFDLILVVWENAMSLPENKQAEFIREATPILLKHIH